VWVGALVFEVTWIVVQAARGVDSHFDDRTAFGGLMLAWTGEALVDVNRSQTAMDAEVVLPVLGWRLDGSDPRPAHFVAAHLMQLLPLLAVWMAASAGAQRLGRFFGTLVCLTGCTLFLTLWLLPLAVDRTLTLASAGRFVR
jgi:hypothetical protein